MGCLLYRNCATLELPGGCSVNVHLYKVAILNVALVVRLGEEHQFVRAVATAPLPASMGRVFLLNQYFLNATQVLLVDFQGDAGLYLFHCMQSALLFRQWNVIIPASRYRTRTHRVGCYVYNIKANFFKQVKCMLKFFFDFSTKTYNDVCGHRDTWP